MTPPPLPPRESLTVEFKSDRTRLSDRELVEAVVCLANAEGGELWLGVEDDGTPTGLHVEHQNLSGVGGLVAARTSPSVMVTVTPVHLGGVAVAHIAVPKAGSEVGTTSGVYLRRRIKHDGTPECTPMLPHDRASRAAHFGWRTRRHSPWPAPRWLTWTRWSASACARACSSMAATVGCWNWTTKRSTAR